MKTVPARYYVPNTDIYETEEALTLVMEMPGVEKKDVNVQLENDVLRVEGRIDFAKSIRDRRRSRTSRTCSSTTCAHEELFQTASPLTAPQRDRRYVGFAKAFLGAVCIDGAFGIVEGARLRNFTAVALAHAASDFGLV